MNYVIKSDDSCPKLHNFECDYIMQPLIRYKRPEIINPNLTSYMGSLKNCCLFMRTFFIVLSVFVIFTASSQEDKDNELAALMNYTEQVLGSDDELVNGEIYYQENFNAEGYPFLDSDEWRTSDLTINGKLHADQRLKYNIETDKIVAVIEQKNGATYSILLNTDYIDSFSFGNRLFINNNHIKISEAKSDFLEEIYKGNFAFYSTYKKMFVNEYTNKTPYGKYSKTTSSYFLLDGSGSHKISSKKLLLKHFEPHKKEIGKFMSKNDIKYKKATVNQLKQLMEYCNELTNNQ